VPHSIEDIICYFLSVVPYYIGIQPPWGHLLGPRSQCNYPTFSYKRPDGRQEKPSSTQP
jgi:hypothetical protein